MTVAVQDGAIILSCGGAEFIRARAALLSAIGSNCHAERGRIVVPLMCADVVLDLFPDVASTELLEHAKTIDAHREAVIEANSEFNSLKVDRIPSKWADVLDIPQQYAVNAIIHPRLSGACLFDEQGTGKTVMALSAYDILQEAGAVERAIVVAPKSMLGGWSKDIHGFTGGKYSIGIVEGDAEKKRQVVEQGHDVIIVNYEGIASVLVLLKAITRQFRTMLIVDESYYAKNPDTLRAELLSKLRPLCCRCLVLCGTPAPRSAYDIISQVNLADNGFAFSTFSRGASEESDRDRVAEVLHTRALAIRRLKQDVISDVPAKNFEIIRVPLSGRQKYMYQKARDELIVELRSFDNKTFKKHLASYFQKRTALLEICAVPRMVDPLFAEVSAKLNALVQLVHRLASQGRKVLIWTCYRDSVSEIASALEELSPLIIDGSVSSGERRAAAVEQFQNDPAALVMIANPAAAGAGITLHASYDAIYYSYTNQAAHYLQSLDRIHRRGQKAKTVNYYMMICEGTIEENEVRRLRQRELSQHDLLGDVVEWPESLDKALEELSNEGTLL